MDCKIFVISLLNSDRRGGVQQQFVDYNIPYVLFDAIDCRIGVPTQYAHMVDKKKAYQSLNRHLSNGEIGCALSHHLLYKHIVDNGIERAIVIEDDAILTDAFNTFYHDKLYKTSGADMIFLYHVGACVHPQYKTIGGVKYYTPKYMPYSTVAYYINHAVAKALLRASTPIKDVADYVIECTACFDVHAVYPRIIKHPPMVQGQSYIDTHRSVLQAGSVDKTPGWRTLWRIVTGQRYRCTRHRYRSFWDYTTRRFVRGTALNISPEITGDRCIPPKSLWRYVVITMARYIKVGKKHG